MKARIKETGEIVDILRWGADGSYTVYLNSKGKEVNDTTLSFFEDFDIKANDNYIDWEERRYQIAKEILPTFMILLSQGFIKDPIEDSVIYADRLIKQLKGE